MNRYRVEQGKSVDLHEWDADATSELPGDKKAARRELKDLVERLAELQHVMWAQNEHKMLVVLQAMDTGGKDSTIRSIFSGVNPQGVRVTNYKAPTSRELDHDYLWRVHAHTPGNGEIAVFNRSHYEDVLAVRVLNLVPEERWRRRYGHIRDFERLLVDEGTSIVKLYLHITKTEQAARLQARIDERHKSWKFDESDLKHRALWSNYMEAFEDALSKTSTDDAPWYIVPANRKWYRNLVVARILVATLEKLDISFPPPIEGLTDVEIC